MNSSSASFAKRSECLDGLRDLKIVAGVDASAPYVDTRAELK